MATPDLSPREWAVFALTLLGTVVSFVGLLTQAAGLKSDAKLEGYGIAFLAVTMFVSWMMTHVTFAMRYAHEFYSRDVTVPQREGDCCPGLRDDRDPGQEVGRRDR